MNKAFEQISLIEGVIAAAFVSNEGKLVGWCSNSAISPEALTFVSETCRVILSANRAEQRSAHTGVVAFGDRTLYVREGATGIFMAYLDSPTNDAVLVWFWDQVRPILESEGIKIEIPTS